MTVNIETLISKLTLEEKILLLGGESTWRTAAVERLSIPRLKVSDGPSGARGEIFGEGVPAAFLPVGVSLGATWDVSILREMGELLAEETKSKSASVILSPTMCIPRNPFGGRNFESYSEDPFLTGKLASALVNGVQSQGIGATPKHFALNDQETNRFHVNAVVSPRALREVYLRPFQMVVRDADPWCMMTAYNKVNGHHCDANRELLTDIARHEWEWKGLFMSDWGGTTSTAPSLNAGLDLEMPGPPSKRAMGLMRAQINAGEVDRSRIDESVKRLLELLVKAGRFEDPSDEPEVCLNKPEQRSKLCHAASSGIVLLKNNNKALPLRPAEGLKKLAIVGPNAKRIVAGGGGSSYIKAPYWTSIYGSIESRFEETVTQIVHSKGAKVNRYLPTAPASMCRDPVTFTIGAAIEWFNGHDVQSKPVALTHVEDLYYISFGNTPPEIVEETNFSYRMKTILTPATSGLHKLSLSSIGPSKLYIDGVLVLSETGEFEQKATLFFTYGSNEILVEKEMVAGREYDIQIEGHSHDRQLRQDLVDKLDPMEDKFQGVRLGYEERDTSNLPAEAALLAKGCDATVVVVGRDKEWETEGQDMQLFELPGEQARMIESVAAVCPRTIVVIQAGTPVNMEPWIHKVDAVLYCWYQGQELGNAAADVICGKFNPSGRLPVTFPRRIQDIPAFATLPAPGENSEILYSEGIHVGYRWWDLLEISPLFPIGFGLSYSKFEISEGSLSSRCLTRNGLITITTLVKNLGGSDVPGRQTVIAFSSQASNQRLPGPKKQICGFAKTPELRPGDACSIKIDVDAYGLGSYEPARKLWIIDANSKFDILLGTNADDATKIDQVEISEEITWIHRL